MLRFSPSKSYVVLLKLNHHVNRHLASLGALIVVLSLFIDPLAQELVSYPVHQVERGHPPVRRTHQYTSQTTGMDPLKGLEYPMRGAVYSGLFAAELVAELELVCTIGNCIWQLFSTLAFCSACSNVTLSTTKDCKDHPMDGPGTKCVYTLPSGMRIAFSTYSDGADNMDAGILTNTSSAIVATKHSPHIRIRTGQQYWQRYKCYGMRVILLHSNL